ncbi:MAG: 4-hydroxy-tetrahydrodipicolinate synthase [Arcobacteraceae bacterium]|jgi:4-hydroxy-tetrahydrodipicolinate synthase|nr:4-hydroxy-tetrahydrodipicolinate synthase [Arcobacteraceae bacterium]
MMSNITGAMTALVTPIKNGKLDTLGFEKLIKRQIAQGMDAVVPVGTTGESATLTYEEDRECIEIAVSVCKGTNVKVIAGAGSNATHEAVETAKFAQKIGADGILSVTPYYNKPTQEGLYQHYKAISESIEIPVMLYNVPGRTGVDLLPSTVARLVKDVKNIYAIKEATGSLDRIIELMTLSPELVVISGDDATDLPMMCVGGQGCISVTANLVPNLKSKLIRLAQEKKLEEAKALNEHLFELNRVLFCESNPIPIKAAMYIAGLIDTLEFRLPLTPPSKENMQKIEQIIKKYDIIL